MKLTDRILKLTIIFTKITKRGRFTRNQWGSQQAVVKDPRDDPDGSKKGKPEGQKKNNWAFLNENFTTWPATQVCRRPVKSGLGGHDDGVSGVDDGVENASLWFWNGDEWPGRNVQPSVIFGDLRMKTAVRTETSWEILLCYGVFFVVYILDSSLTAGNFNLQSELFACFDGDFRNAPNWEERLMLVFHLTLLMMPRRWNGFYFHCCFPYHVPENHWRLDIPTRPFVPVFRTRAMHSRPRRRPPKRRRRGLPDQPWRVSDRLVSPAMSSKFSLQSHSIILLSSILAPHSSTRLGRLMGLSPRLGGLPIGFRKITFFLWLFC